MGLVSSAVFARATNEEPTESDSARSAAQRLASGIGGFEIGEGKGEGMRVLTAHFSSRGDRIRAAGPSQGANCTPSGGSERSERGGRSFAPPGRPKARIAPPR